VAVEAADDEEAGDSGGCWLLEDATSSRMVSMVMGWEVKEDVEEGLLLLLLSRASTGEERVEVQAEREEEQGEVEIGESALGVTDEESCANSPT
jgi:hypothetical protein